MTTWIRNSALATVAAAGLLAAAQPLLAGSGKIIGEGQAITTELGGSAKAITYWTNHPQGTLVVTTVDSVAAPDTDLEQHAVVRLQTVLQPGQAQEVSIPLAVGAEQPVLRIERVADQITVTKISQ